MLKDKDQSEKLKEGLVSGAFDFDPKYVRTKRYIRWSGWRPYIETVYIVTDRKHCLLVE